MKPARILIILVAAFFAAGVDGMGLRPLRAELFVPKAKTKALVGPTRPTQGANPPGTEAGHRDEPADALTAAEVDRLTRSGEAVVIDARPAAQYEAGHIPFAIHLPFEAFAGGRPGALDFYPPDQQFIIYCGGGDCDASEKVQIMLDAVGFPNSRVYRPGWPGWLEFGGEVETTPSEG